jgi:hypothetical protein
MAVVDVGFSVEKLLQEKKEQKSRKTKQNLSGLELWMYEKDKRDNNISVQRDTVRLFRGRKVDCTEEAILQRLANLRGAQKIKTLYANRILDKARRYKKAQVASVILKYLAILETPAPK